MRFFRPLALIAVLAAAWVVMPGCGDDNPSNPDLCLQNPDSCAAYVDSIRMGTWELLLNLSTNNSICQEIIDDVTEGTTDTLILCSLDDLFGDDGGEFPCEYEVQGRSFSVSCASTDTVYTGETTFCVLSITISASGTFTNTMVNGSGVATITITGNDPECAFGFSCTANLSLNGRWLSDEGAETCPAPVAPSALGRLLGRTIG